MVGQVAFDAAVSAMPDNARGWQLAEMRKRRRDPQHVLNRLSARWVALSS
jgi:hypothetical protein